MLPSLGAQQPHTNLEQHVSDVRLGASALLVDIQAARFNV